MGSPRVEDLSPAPEVLHERAPAVMWRRAAARGIDLATVVCVLWLLVVTQLFWFMNDLSDRFDPKPWQRGFVATLTFVVLSAIYEVLFLVHNKGQTPGKDIMKLRVIRVNGRLDIAPVVAFRRWLVPGISVMLSPMWMAAAAVAATGVTLPLGARRRALHDVVAGTLVIPFDREREDPTAGRSAPCWRRRLMNDRNANDEGFDGDD